MMKDGGILIGSEPRDKSLIQLSATDVDLLF